MTIHSILSQNSPRLQDTDSVAVATRMLLEHRLAALPVVDATGRYLGIFSMDRLLSLLLPKAVLIEGGVTDLSFMSDPLDILCERMQQYRSEPVGSFIETGARVLHPDTPLLETVLLLYRGENDIPVVDSASGQLLGMVIGAELLQRVCERGDA
jgi:CBS-domain-containing membrane protein